MEAKDTSTTGRALTEKEKKAIREVFDNALYFTLNWSGDSEQYSAYLKAFSGSENEKKAAFFDSLYQGKIEKTLKRICAGRDNGCIEFTAPLEEQAAYEGNVEAILIKAARLLHSDYLPSFGEDYFKGATLAQIQTYAWEYLAGIYPHTDVNKKKETLLKQGFDLSKPKGVINDDWKDQYRQDLDTARNAWLDSNHTKKLMETISSREAKEHEANKERLGIYDEYKEQQQSKIKPGKEEETKEDKKPAIYDEWRNYAQLKENKRAIAFDNQFIQFTSSKKRWDVVDNSPISTDNLPIPSGLRPKEDYDNRRIPAETALTWTKKEKGKWEAALQPTGTKPAWADAVSKRNAALEKGDADKGLIENFYKALEAMGKFPAERQNATKYIHTAISKNGEQHAEKIVKSLILNPRQDAPKGSSAFKERETALIKAVQNLIDYKVDTSSLGKNSAFLG